MSTYLQHSGFLHYFIRLENSEQIVLFSALFLGRANHCNYNIGHNAHNPFQINYVGENAHCRTEFVQNDSYKACQ